MYDFTAFIGAQTPHYESSAPIGSHITRKKSNLEENLNVRVKMFEKRQNLEESSNFEEKSNSRVVT